MKKYINLSIIYAILAMISGVFYREFTKFLAFNGKTSLSVMHTHYFMLGMFFFLVLLLLEKNFSISKEKNTDRLILFYQIGLNITLLMLFVRGILEVLGSELTKALNASISGLAGLGHILLGISLIMILLKLKKRIGQA